MLRYDALAQLRAVGPTGAERVAISISVQALSRNDFLRSRARQLQPVLSGWSGSTHSPRTAHSHDPVATASVIVGAHRRNHRGSGPTLDAHKPRVELNRCAPGDGIEVSDRSSLIKKLD